MKRKIMGVFGILLMLAALMQSACATPNLASEFAFVEFEDHVEILGYEGTSSVVEVPATIAGKPVTSVRLGKTQADTSNRFLGVRKIILPSTVKELGSSAFGYYTQLESVEGLEYIERITGSNIFTFCGLKEAHFSASLREVASDAFGDSGRLQRVTIPDDAQYGTRALTLSGVSELTLLRGENEPTIILKDGVVFSADGKQLIAILPLMQSPYYAVPEGTESIGMGAFSTALYLEELEFPSSVKSIVNDAGGLYLLDHDVIVRAPKNSYAYGFYQDYAANGGTDAENLTVEALEDHSSAVLSERVQEILSQCITDDMTDLQKARVLHDWICEYGSYDYTLSKFSASDILVDGSGVCDAYTRAYCVLLDAAGIECRRITCQINNVGHAITAVKIENDWIYIDVTNDDEGFGHPADLFGFNDDVYNAFYVGETGLQANTLAYYAPYAAGELTAALNELTEQINARVQNGEVSFTVALTQGTSQVRVAALCSLLQAQMWGNAGAEYTLICSTSDNKAFSCIMAGRAKSPEYSSFVNARGNLTLTAYHGNAASVVVPATIDGKTVDALSGTFQGNKTIVSVVLPEGLKEIGMGAFLNCEALETINFPQSLTAIGEQAFSGCVRLESGLVFAEGLESIGEFAFSMCYNVKTALIPGSVKTIGIYAFSQCSTLVNVTLGEGITALPKSVFNECVYLKKMTLPDSLLTIGEAAFDRSGITAVHIPANVSDIHWGAFAHAEMLTSLTIDADNSYYAVKDNMLFTKDMKTLVASTLAIAASPVIPSGVETIGEYAFTHNSTLKTIRIPSNVKVIEAYAFCGCGVTSVYIENGVEAIGRCAFSSEALWVGNIGGYAFTTLTNLRLPDTLVSIGESAFSGYHPGLEMILPDSLTRIDVSFITGNRHLYVPETISYIEPQQIEYAWDEMVIHGVPGSYAEEFAETYGYRFESTVETLELNIESIMLLEQATCVLEPKTLNGKDASAIADEITWESDADCVSVAGGVVTAHSMGNATVTATWNGISASCEVTVGKLTAPGALYCLGFDGPLLRMNEMRYLEIYGGVDQLEEEDGEWNTVQQFISLNNHGSWSVSDPSVIKLNRKGNNVEAVAIGPGKCTVTVIFPTGETASIDLAVAAAQYVDPDECEHVMTTAAALSPTCVADGLTEGRYCELCGEVSVAQNVIPALGHKLTISAATLELEEGDVLALADFAEGCAHLDEFILTGKASNSDKLTIAENKLCALDTGLATILVSAELPDGFGTEVSLAVVIHAQETMTLPAALTEIGEEAFAHIAAEEIILQKETVTIGSHAFANSGVKLITIPASVSYIAPDAFEGCAAAILTAAGSYAESFAIEHNIQYMLQ